VEYTALNLPHKEIEAFSREILPKGIDLMKLTKDLSLADYGEPNIKYRLEHHPNLGVGAVFFENGSTGTTVVASLLIESSNCTELGILLR